jgi:hypothetical protein
VSVPSQYGTQVPASTSCQPELSDHMGLIDHRLSQGGGWVIASSIHPGKQVSPCTRCAHITNTSRQLTPCPIYRSRPFENPLAYPHSVPTNPPRNPPTTHPKPTL